MIHQLICITDMLLINCHVEFITCILYIFPWQADHGHKNNAMRCWWLWLFVYNSAVKGTYDCNEQMQDVVESNLTQWSRKYSGL